MDITNQANQDTARRRTRFLAYGPTEDAKEEQKENLYVQLDMHGMAWQGDIREKVQPGNANRTKAKLGDRDKNPREEAQAKVNHTTDEAQCDFRSQSSNQGLVFAVRQLEEKALWPKLSLKPNLQIRVEDDTLP
ncbi:hypothetical protein ILUMI_22995 [Ignelater luminosus]|uniref:Uncharacterized protein n=1 Tax=Ignelater luminosus TaxID=2038154 RepID=A0A8K0C9L6_IGNLU|nr:hypothetical protein ILUMI_22995 [Ignelater luminosus]